MSGDMRNSLLSTSPTSSSGAIEEEKEPPPTTSKHVNKFRQNILRALNLHEPLIGKG